VAHAADDKEEKEDADDCDDGAVDIATSQ